jgi:hypothetical protein
LKSEGQRGEEEDGLTGEIESGEAVLEVDGMVTPVVCVGEGNVDGMRAMTAKPDA